MKEKPKLNLIKNKLPPNKSNQSKTKDNSETSLIKEK